MKKIKSIEEMVSREELDKNLEYLDNNPMDTTGTGNYITSDFRYFLLDTLSEAIDYHYREGQITAKSSDKVPEVKDEYEENTEFVISCYKW